MDMKEIIARVPDYTCFMTVDELDDRFVAIEERLALLEARRARRPGDEPG